MKVVQKEEKNVVVDERVEQEVKTPELCAVPKDFVIEKLNVLYKDNKALFDEYNVWMNVLNSQVKVTNQEEIV